MEKVAGVRVHPIAQPALIVQDVHIVDRVVPVVYEVVDIFLKVAPLPEHISVIPQKNIQLALHTN